jgi:glycosyltransferase involved in cell wall biosynthesis
MKSVSNLGVVVIGRNEGERLKRCLHTLPDDLPVIYVDSGSTDESVAFAHSFGATVIQLDLRHPFTAARARNAGLKKLLELEPNAEFVQFIDGDCEIFPAWFDCAVDALSSEPHVAAIFGRLRERFPDRSIYNRMCDSEWDVPIGVVDHCGGNAMIRISSISAVNGFQDDLVAGEEPDLCLRMGRLGFVVQRIDCEMGFHDAAMYSIKNWWSRTKRSGYAYAEHVWRHGKSAIPSWRAQLLSIVFWPIALPIAILSLSMAMIGPIIWSIAIALIITSFIYFIQILRIAFRIRDSETDLGFTIISASFLVFGKIPQFLGASRCWLNHLFQREQQIFEHRTVG